MASGFVNLPVHVVALLINIAQTFADGAPNEDRYADAIIEARAELEAQGLDADALATEALGA